MIYNHYVLLQHWNKHCTTHDHHKKETCVWNTEGHKTREIQKRIILLDGCHAISQKDPMKFNFFFDFTINVQSWEEQCLLLKYVKN